MRSNDFYEVGCPISCSSAFCYPPPLHGRGSLPMLTNFCWCGFCSAACSKRTYSDPLPMPFGRALSILLSNFSFTSWLGEEYLSSKMSKYKFYIPSFIRRERILMPYSDGRPTYSKAICSLSELHSPRSKLMLPQPPELCCGLRPRTGCQRYRFRPP